jgi:hypothetical protein
MGQIRLSKGFMGLMAKAPVFGRGFFYSYSIIEGWRKLFCNGDVIGGNGVSLVWGLTWEFVGNFGVVLCKLLIFRFQTLGSLYSPPKREVLSRPTSFKVQNDDRR